MPRLIIQSLATGHFLVPGGHHEVEWQRSLYESGGGIVHEMEQAEQLLRDNCDLDDEAIIVDVDHFLSGN